MTFPFYYSNLIASAILILDEYTAGIRLASTPTSTGLAADSFSDYYFTNSFFNKKT